MNDTDTAAHADGHTQSDTDTSVDYTPPARRADSGTPEEGEDSLIRGGRRYSVANQRGKARAKLRYIESNHSSKGCRFF